MSESGVAGRDLVRRAQNGDESAFRELVNRYLRTSLAIAWEFTDSREDAEDVVQETFRRVASSLDKFDVTRPFRPWFFTILRNAARDSRRSSAKDFFGTLEESVPDEEPSAQDLVEWSELQARVDMELSSLSEMQRVCFRLCALEGLSSVEVADALNVNEATVRTHVFRARNTMRAAMEPFKEELWDR